MPESATRIEANFEAGNTPPALAPETKECPHCAERILAAAKVCRYCSRKQPLSAKENERRSLNRMTIGVSLGVVALLILCAVALERYQESVNKLDLAVLRSGNTLSDSAQHASH